MRLTAAKSLVACLLLGCCGLEADQRKALTAEDVETLAGLRAKLAEVIVVGDAASYASLCTEEVKL